MTGATEPIRRWLGSVDPALAEELASAATQVRLRAGETLFEAGEDADAVYVVVRGRLRASVAGPDGYERPLSDIGRDELVGEVALLTGTPRTATVRAVRDTELARLPAAAFDELVARHPESVHRLMRLLAERLERAGRAEPVSAARTVAVVAAPGQAALGHARTIAEGLVEVDAAAGRRTRLVAAGDVPAGSGDDPDRLGRWLEDEEAAHDALVLLADDSDGGWAAAVEGAADHMLVVASGRAGPWGADATRAGPRGATRTAVIVRPAGQRPAGTAAWLRALDVDAHRHVEAGSARDVDRLGRLLRGSEIGLVLGGGGARGWAEVGVLRAIDELGIPIDAVGGTSFGALVGGALASGWSWSEILERGMPLTRSLFDVTLPLVSFVAGRRIGAAVREVAVDRRIEDLALPYFSVATNLTRAERLVLERGPLGWAIRASISLPAVLPPLSLDGDLIVDGGVLDNLPVEVMQRRAGRVVAVDVDPEVEPVRYPDLPAELSGFAVLGDRLRRRVRAGRGTRRYPDLGEIVQRTAVAGGVHARRARERAGAGDGALVIRPPVAGYTTLDYGAGRALADIGYRSAIEPLAAWWEAQGRT